MSKFKKDNFKLYRFLFNMVLISYCLVIYMIYGVVNDIESISSLCISVFNLLIFSILFRIEYKNRK